MGRALCLPRPSRPRPAIADLNTEDGRIRVVRHGHLPEREVMTGIGPVAMRNVIRYRPKSSRVLSLKRGSPSSVANPKLPPRRVAVNSRLATGVDACPLGRSNSLYR